MSNSQDVFRLRRAKQIDEAYALAREGIESKNADEWDIRALSWCLIDLIKAAADQGNKPKLAAYAAELKELAVPDADELLEKQRNFVLSLAEDGRHEILAARAHSKAGRYEEAARIYTDLMAKSALYPDDHPGYGWDLYRWTKDVLSAGPKGPDAASIGQARRNLIIYMKLVVERPSVLHSCMLQMASQLAMQDQLKLPAFLKLWDLENLRSEDYERFTTDDGKTLPALAEKVVQRAAKEAAASDDAQSMHDLLPFLEQMMEKFPDNVWFRLSRVKFLRGLGQHVEARAQAIEFAREKSRESWAWDLLGDLQESADLRMACYCKGLLCASAEEFIGPLRLKLARELRDAGHMAEAKGEIEAVMAHRRQMSQRIPKVAERLVSEPWFSAAIAAAPDRRFYTRFAPQADEILFADIPWINACAGDSFTLEGEVRKTLRKIYVPGDSMPLEVSVPEKALGLKGLTAGQPIRIKADLDTDGAHRIKLYAASHRETGAPYDIFPEKIGIVDQVNTKRDVLHVIAGRDLGGIVPLADVVGAAVGDCLALRLARFRSRNGGGVRVVSAAQTDLMVSEQVCRPFQENVRVSNDMGFTPSGVFVPPHLVRDNKMQEGDVIAGRAVINFDKKKSSWGWKAIVIDPSERKSKSSDQGIHTDVFPERDLSHLFGDEKSDLVKALQKKRHQ